MFKMSHWLGNYLMKEENLVDNHLCDFDKIVYELRPADVVLVEGQSIAARVIQQVTLSPWSHAFIYVGRVHQIEDKSVRKIVESHPGIDLDSRLIIEGFMGKGIVFSTLESYSQYHLRICRPKGISRHDAQSVINCAIGQVGFHYDNWQIFDLFRFLIPWSILPKTWRSSLFTFKPGHETKTVCSTMIAKSFQSVQFPILPLVQVDEKGSISLYHRNPKLYTPKDFDYSPYFEIIKYPFIENSNPALYRHLPWKEKTRGHLDNTDWQQVDRADLPYNEETLIKDSSQCRTAQNDSVI